MTVSETTGSELDGRRHPHPPEAFRVVCIFRSYCKGLGSWRKMCVRPSEC